MRPVVLLLSPALVAGCVRLQGLEADAAKVHTTGSHTGGAGTRSPVAVVFGTPDATVPGLAEARGEKGIEVFAGREVGRDRNEALAWVLTARAPGTDGPPRALVYLCAEAGTARELSGQLGEGAFAAGRFALGPYRPTDGDRALSRKIRAALSPTD